MTRRHCQISPPPRLALDKVAATALWVKPLWRFAPGEHHAYQVEQRPGEVMLGDQNLPITHAEMVDRATAG
jgi:hypothetical protein